MGGQSLPRNAQQKKHQPKRVAKRKEKEGKKITNIVSMYRDLTSKRFRVAKILFINAIAALTIAAIFVICRNIMGLFEQQSDF